jgi:hypothetical protein
LDEQFVIRLLFDLGWYPENFLHRAAYLRQTIMLSQYDTPEGRAFFKSLKNIDGKIRSTTRWDPLQVPADIEQVSVTMSPC